MLLTACGEGQLSENIEQTSDNSGNSSSVQSEDVLELPNMDFGRRDFRVLGYAAPVYTQFSNFEIDSDGETRETVNDAVYR